MSALPKVTSASNPMKSSPVPPELPAQTAQGPLAAERRHHKPHPLLTHVHRLPRHLPRTPALASASAEV